MGGQPSFLALIAKAIAIAIGAAVSAALALVVVTSTFENTGIPSLQSAYALFVVALMGSFMIGLPVALLVYLLSWRHLVRFPTTLPLVTVLSVIVMTIASFVVGGPEGILFLGLPAAFAAATYAGLGLFWIIKPMRKANHG